MDKSGSDDQAPESEAILELSKAARALAEESTLPMTDAIKSLMAEGLGVKVGAMGDAGLGAKIGLLGDLGLAAKTASIGRDLDALQSKTPFDARLPAIRESQDVALLRRLDRGIGDLVELQDRAIAHSQATNRQLEVLVSATVRSEEAASKAERVGRRVSYLALGLAALAVILQILQLLLPYLPVIRP